jgi:SAM-dependent methyltransferase
VGLDLSDNMVVEYNKSACEMGIPPEKMSAQRGDLLAETVPKHLSGPDFRNFDIAAIGMAIHHIESPQLALKRLAGRLRKGGVCFIMDLFPSQHQLLELRKFCEEHPEIAATINKHGFTKEEMQKLYQNAGLGGRFDYVVVEKPLEFTMNGQKHSTTAFMARGELL